MSLSLFLNGSMIYVLYAGTSKECWLLVSMESRTASGAATLAQFCLRTPAPAVNSINHLAIHAG